MIQDGAKERPKLQPDDVTASVVKRIFNMAENGTGMLDIARAINDEDIPSATGKLWSSTGVNFILRNEVYTGTLVWGTRTKDGADLVRVEGAFPAIVSKEQFQSVNKLLRSRGSKTTHPRRTASSYLLSGLITCYRCRTAFTGHGAKSGRFHYYVCQSLIKRGSGSCDSPRLNARRFEELIIGRARSSILTKDSNGDQMTVVVKELDRLIQEQRGRLEIIESELNEVRNRLDRLWYIVESTDVDPADTAPRIRANRDRQVRLETSLQEGNAILSQRRAIRDDVVIMTAKALDMPEFLEKSELPERKVFVETFIRDIVVMPGKAGGPPAAQLATRGQRPSSPPLRPRNMKDPRRNNGRKRPGEQELEDALERSMPSYTPEHRRAVLKGLRILARVAIRSYMEEQAAASHRAETGEDGGEEEGQRGV